MRPGEQFGGIRTQRSTKKSEKTDGLASPGDGSVGPGSLAIVKLFIFNVLAAGVRVGGENVLNLNKISQCSVILSEILLRERG